MGKSQKTSSAPWEGVAPFIRRTAKLGFESFGDGGLAPAISAPSDNTRDAWQGAARLARDNPVTRNAVNALPGMIWSSPTAGLEGIRENIAGEVLPQVAGMFGQGGFMNSTMAQDTAAKAMTNALAPYEYDQFNRNVDNRFRALSLAPTVQSMQYRDLGALAGVGAARDDLRARREDSDRQNILEAAKLFGGLGGLGGTQAQTPSTLQTVGGLGQLGISGALAYSLLCDRRLKADIERVGEFKSVPIYMFRYLWDAEDVRRVGPMADEAPPHAVSEINGVQVVNMGAL